MDPIAAPRREDGGGPALADVADALERLGVGAQPEEDAEPRLVLRVLQGFGTGEHRGEVVARHERGEHEVDEAALVAATTPLVEALRGVLCEGPVAAPEDVVVLVEPGEPLGDPELGARPR